VLDFRGVNLTSTLVDDAGAASSGTVLARGTSSGQPTRNFLSVVEALHVNPAQAASSMLAATAFDLARPG
jgi:hypothetical protein